jgi:hypothetical protein
MSLQRRGQACGDFPHHIGRIAVELVDEAGKIERLLQRPDRFVLIRLPAPIITSPLTVASGATQASASIDGACPA